MSIEESARPALVTVTKAAPPMAALVTVTATTASPPVAAVAVMEEASSSDIGVGGFISLLAGLDQFGS